MKNKKITSIFLSLSLVASMFTVFPASAAELAEESIKSAAEPIELIYNDSNGSGFESFTYNSANPDKTYTLVDGTQLGEGELAYTFHLDSGNADCHYRAGLQIAGKNILINALNGETATGNWPSQNNNGWQIDGYHINYSYSAVTADVTFTVALNGDGKATEIDCLLIDGQNSQANGTITLEQPAPVDTIKLVSDERGGWGNITLSNFKAVYSNGEGGIATAPPTEATEGPTDPLESSDLVYNDSNGSRFESFTYNSSNPDKTYTLADGTQLGEGELEYTYHLDCGGKDCHYRAGISVAGKTILINALNKETGTGDWPSANNDGWHVDGYHMNYNYAAVTADVTLTFTLNSEGKATAIDCLLIDGKNAQAHGTITLDQPASVNTIKLVSEERGGSSNISLTNFKAVYSNGEGGIATTPPTEATERPTDPSESSDLVYNDSNGSRFESFTYNSSNPNKTYALAGGTRLGEGELTYTYHLDCGGKDCHYRAGIVVAGKTILINALNKETGTGDWPSTNNDGWHVDGYHMNYNHAAVTADVTLTVTLNSDGKATAIDCLLIDGKNAQAHGTITLNQPASVDTIKLVSEERGGSGIISLTNFGAKCTGATQTVATAAKLPVKNETFNNDTIPGYYATNIGESGKLAAENGWLTAKKSEDGAAVTPDEDAFVITMDKSIAAGTKTELTLSYTNANEADNAGIQAFVEGNTLAVSDEVHSGGQAEYRCEIIVPQHSDDWQIVLKVNKDAINPKIKNVSIKVRKEKYTSVDVDYSVDNGVSHRVASGALHGIDYKTPAGYLSDGIYLKALRGQAKHHEQDNGYEYLPGFLYEKTYDRVIERGEDTKLMIGLYYGYKPLANQVGGWQNMALENGGKYWKDYIHEFMGEYYNEDGTTNRDVYSWIPWNEPDLQWGGVTDDFCKAYENAYDAVKEVDPSARVQGPECSWYEGGKMKNFLLYCKENNCLPEVLSWHELQPYKLEIEAHCKEMYDFMIANNIEPMEMAITEYQGLGYDETDEGRRKDGNYNTGLAVSYISELENSEQYGMNYGLRSAWSYGGGDPRAKAYLGEMTDVETATMPTGLWYVYNAYKRMTGRKVGITITDPDYDDAISALAALDSTVEDKSSTILVGNWKSGNTDDYEAAKDIKVTLKNIPDYLIADGKVNVKIEQIEETLAVPLYSPTVISDKTYEVTNGTVELEVTELCGRRAMAVTVTTPETAVESVNMSTLNPQASEGITIDTSNGYVKAVGGKAPTYKDETQEAPALTTTYKDNGDSVTFTAKTDEEGQYNLRITHKTGAENGFMQLYIDDKAVCYPIDLYSAADGEKTVNYGNVYLAAGEHKLCFKIVGYGKNRKSSACTLTFGDMTLAKLQDTGVTKVVTFDPAGGKVSQATTLVKDKIAQLPAITREGYKFLGWFDKDGNQITENTAVSESMTVTAKWEQSYTVQLIGNRDICSLAYDEQSKKATITIKAVQGSEINITANNEDISDRLVYENATYTLKDYEISKNTVFIVNAIIPEPDSYDPYIQNEAEKYSESHSIQTENCDEGGRNVGYIVNGSWLMYKKMDFGSNGAAKFEVRVASATNGGKIELRLDSTDGPVIGTVDVENTGGWQNWVTKSCDVHDAKGLHNLYLTITGGDGNLFNLNWWKFTEAEAPKPEDKTFKAEIANTVIEGSELKVTVNVENKTDENVQAQVITALYNKDGVLQEIKLNDAVSFESGKSVSIDSKFTKPAGNGNYVKAIVWDSVESMCPKTQPCTYTLDN